MTNSPTIRDVARQAGVSVATVSRSLNNQPGITEETRRRVLSAASALGYDLGNLRQNRLRRLVFLYRRQRETVGGNPFYSHVLHGVEEACRAGKLGLSYSSVGPEDRLTELVARQEGEGLVCVGYFEPAQLDTLLGLNLLIAGYVSRAHQRGVMDVMTYLRERHETAQNTIKCEMDNTTGVRRASPSACPVVESLLEGARRTWQSALPRLLSTTPL